MNFLSINSFKCFENIEISLNQLTIFAGANGNGKSTVIQAILLLRKTIEECFNLSLEAHSYSIENGTGIAKEIALNSGIFLSLGNSSHVLNRSSNQISINIGINYNNEEIIFCYDVDNKTHQLFLLAQTYISEQVFKMPIYTLEFYYLNAERIGPRLTQKIEFFYYPNAGWQGEFVAQLISENSGYLAVEKERLFGHTTNSGLEFQVNAWLNEIMPGVRISAKRSPETFTSQIQIENIYTKGDPVLATNIGFGISYILPIIATGLIAKAGSFFIVENPEAHLHPSAQSKIGKFLAMVANAGVHVIVETHSDHLINGLQIAVAQGKIKNDLVTINYFSQSDGNTQPDVLPISISEKGELSDWPRGFFDQTQIDFAELFKLRRG